MLLRIRGAGRTLVILGAACACAHASSIVNGDFETGDLTGWTAYTTSYSGGTGTGTAGTCSGSVPCPIVAPFNTVGTGASDAAEFNVGIASGPFGGTLFQGAGLYQDIVLDPGSYTVSLDWAINATADNVDGGRFAILVNGNELNAYDSGFVSNGSVTRGTLYASATIAVTGTYQLAFEVTRNYVPVPSVMQYVDNVTLDNVTPSDPVPEPATWALALAAMLVLRRRVRNG